MTARIHAGSAFHPSIEGLHSKEYSHDFLMATDICVRFGNRMRKLRKERGWSQIYFAVHSGLARTFVLDIEKARKEPCLRTLEVIAKSFDLTVSQLTRGL